MKQKIKKSLTFLIVPKPKWKSSESNIEDLRNCKFEEGIFLFGSVAKTLWIRIECKKSFNILIENLRLFSTFALC